MTIIGMPMVSFLAFLSWPFIFTIAAIIIYIIMARQDAKIDDSEFGESVNEQKGGAGK
ncbi:MAG: hypothetical protein RSD88_03195 [Anaerovoracaceae bacterium]